MKEPEKPPVWSLSTLATRNYLWEQIQQPELEPANPEWRCLGGSKDEPRRVRSREVQIFWLNPHYPAVFKKYTRQSSNSSSAYMPKRTGSSFTHMFIAALFIIAKRWKQPKWPLTGEWIAKKWHKHTMDCCSALRRKEVLTYAITWVNLEDIMLSKCYGLNVPPQIGMLKPNFQWDDILAPEAFASD